MKKIKNYIEDINIFFENLLNKLNLKKISFNNLKLFIFEKIYFIILLFIFLPIVYVSIPGIIDKEIIKNKFSQKLDTDFNLNFNLDTDVSYRIFPEPHFLFRNVVISDEKNDFGKINDFRILISLKDLLDIKSIKIKKIIFLNTDFYLNSKDLIFFDKFLKGNLKDKELEIKKSNIFFKNLQDEVLFISKIKNIFYGYDKKDQNNFLKVDSKLFNIKNVSRFFYIDEKLKYNIKFKELDLNLDGILDFGNKYGQFELILSKFLLSVNHKHDKNNLSFSNFTSKNENVLLSQDELINDYFFRGLINFKPFFLNLLIEVGKLNLSDLFKQQSITKEILKSRFIDHENLNYDIRISANQLKNNSSIKDISILINSTQGVIDFNTSNFRYKNNLSVSIDDSLLSFEEDKIKLSSTISIKIDDLNLIYKFFQTPKKFRSKISHVEITSEYSILDSTIEFKEIKVNGVKNENLKNTLLSYNSNDRFLKNKIEFKKFINNLIKNYSDG